MRRSDHAGRIRAKLVYDGDCWLWTGKLRPDGYGVVRLDKQDTRVHRAMYKLLVGPIPEGLVLDHLCRQPACCNPAHLEPVTMVENLNRTRGWNVSPKRKPIEPRSERWKSTGIGATNALKTHCLHGHEYTAENTRVTDGRRWCRACDRERAHRRPSRAKTVDPN